MTWNGSGRRPDGNELTYSEYINVDQLLHAQRLPVEVPRGRTRDEWPQRPTVRDGEAERAWAEGDRWPNEWPHDELLFIVTHQTFELWFRQILHELDDVMAHVTAILAAHGRTLPRSNIQQREPSDAPPFRQVAGRYPQTRAVIESLLTNEWERRWSQELHEPGALPRRDDPSVGAIELGWFDNNTLALFARRLARVAMILKHATGAFDILSTMPPEEFLAFRSRLNPASGFGSTQFREIEIFLGLGEMHRAKVESRGDLSFHRHMPAHEVTRIQARLAAPTLRDLVYAILNASDVRGTDAVAIARADRVMAGNLTSLHEDLDLSQVQFAGASVVENHLHARWRVVDELMTHAENLTLVELYTTQTARPALRELLERCLDVDDALRAWRQTHIPMVERMIGARPGTGGGGIAYLHTTLRASRAFPSLWEFRSILTAPRG